MQDVGIGDLVQQRCRGRAAGSVFYKIKFTNLSGHACTLRGFPRVAR